jgi:hypothetical protein
VPKVADNCSTTIDRYGAIAAFDLWLRQCPLCAQADTGGMKVSDDLQPSAASGN